MTDTTETNPKFNIFLDEAASYIGGNDHLKERIRKIDGVPNVTYKVRGDKVFDALVDLVIMASREKGEDLDDSEVLALIKQAELIPFEAVERYGVWPSQYKPERLSKGGCRIVHWPLNSVKKPLLSGGALMHRMRSFQSNPDKLPMHNFG